jgi:hypothetical protein
VMNPMQYDLERAYHTQRQRAAAQQRFVAEAERHSADASTSARPSVAMFSRLRSLVVRGAEALALPRRQVA